MVHIKSNSVRDQKQNIPAAFVFVFALILYFGSGCGRASNPKAPENFAPGPVQFLSASSSADSVTLSWSMPLQTAGGEALKSDSVVSFVIKKGEIIPEQRVQLEEIGEIIVVEPKVTGAPTITKLDDSGNIANPLGSTLGAGGEKKKEELLRRVFKYTDRTLTPGARYNYQVVGVNGDDVPGLSPKTIRVTFNGDDSKIETITKIDTGATDDTSFSY